MTYPDPPPAPRFVHTPQSLLESTKRIIDHSRSIEDRVAREVTPENATFDSVLGPVAEDENQMVPSPVPRKRAIYIYCFLLPAMPFLAI